MLTLLKSSSLVLVIISRMSVLCLRATVFMIDEAISV